MLDLSKTKEMEMKSLDKYKKKDKLEIHVTSVNIEKKHKEFLDEEKLNLSDMVRDMLDERMKERGKHGGKKD